MRSRDLKEGLEVELRTGYGAARGGYHGVVVNWLAAMGTTDVLVAFDPREYPPAFTHVLHDGADLFEKQKQRNCYIIPARHLIPKPRYEDGINNWV